MWILDLVIPISDVDLLDIAGVQATPKTDSYGPFLLGGSAPCFHGKAGNNSKPLQQFVLWSLGLRWEHGRALKRPAWESVFCEPTHKLRAMIMVGQKELPGFQKVAEGELCWRLIIHGKYFLVAISVNEGASHKYQLAEGYDVKSCQKTRYYFRRPWFSESLRWEARWS